MPEGTAPRVAIEVSFLILLAVGCALADLEPLLIVLVMGVGWLLQVAVEVAAWRAQPRAAAPVAEAAAAPVAEAVEASPPAPALRPEAVEAPEPAYTAEPAPELEYPPEPEAPPAPAYPPAPDYQFEFEQPATPARAEDATGVIAGTPEAEARAAAEPPPGADAEPAEALQFGDERRAKYRLEPLQPRPKRRWFGTRRGQRPGGPEGGA